MSCGSDNLEVNVKGIDGVQAALKVSPTLQISTLKELIEQKIPNYPVARQKLIFRGNVLEDENTIGTYIKEDGLTIHVVVRPEDVPSPNPHAAAVENPDMNFSELFVQMLSSAGALPSNARPRASAIDPASLPWAELQNALRQVSSCHVHDRAPAEQSVQAYLHTLVGIMNVVAGQIFDTTNSNAFPDSIRPRVRASMTLLADVLQSTARTLTLNHENRRRRRRANAASSVEMPESTHPDSEHRHAEDGAWRAPTYYQSHPSFSQRLAVAIPQGLGFAVHQEPVSIGGPPFGGVAFQLPTFAPVSVSPPQVQGGVPPKSPPHFRAAGATPYFKAPPSMPAVLPTSVSRAPAFAPCVIPTGVASSSVSSERAPQPVLQQDLTDSLLRAIETHLASVCGSIANAQVPPAAESAHSQTTQQLNPPAEQQVQAPIPPWLHHPAMPDFRQHAIWNPGMPATAPPAMVTPPATPAMASAMAPPIAAPVPGAHANEWLTFHNIRDFLDRMHSPPLDRISTFAEAGSANSGPEVHTIESGSWEEHEAADRDEVDTVEREGQRRTRGGQAREATDQDAGEDGRLQ